MNRNCLLFVVLLLAACGTQPSREREPDEAGKIEPLLSRHPEVRHAVVAEAWISAPVPADNIDSPATWRDVDGTLKVVATAKSSDRLIVFAGGSGARLQSVGGPGRELGKLNRPNGIATIDDKYAFVVERDNKRVQMFALPDFTPLLAFGSDELQKPYGLWVRALDGAYEVIVSDAYMAGKDARGEDVLPPLRQLDHRFRRYSVRRAANGWTAELAGSFGDTEAAGAIRIPESVFGDVANNRLLIAEEDVAAGTRLREYTLDGKYAGRDVGADVYKAQAEGIALMRCKDGGGWWVASDQYEDRTVFHVFARDSLRLVGSFAGRETGLTDGVWMEERGDARFPHGAFFASHLDRSIAAFDWRDIATALQLPACAR